MSATSFARSRRACARLELHDGADPRAISRSAASRSSPARGGTSMRSSPHDRQRWPRPSISDSHPVVTLQDGRVWSFLTGRALTSCASESDRVTTRGDFRCNRFSVRYRAVVSGRPRRAVVAIGWRIDAVAVKGLRRSVRFAPASWRCSAAARPEDRQFALEPGSRVLRAGEDGRGRFQRSRWVASRDAAASACVLERQRSRFEVGHGSSTLFKEHPR